MSNIYKRAAVLVDDTPRPAHLGLRVGATYPLGVDTAFRATTARLPWTQTPPPPPLRGFS